MPTTLGDFGHQAQHTSPPPWAVPLAVLLPGTLQHHDQFYVAYHYLFACSLLCHRAASPGMLGSSFCSSPGSRFGVISCQKRKIQKRGLALCERGGSSRAVEKTESNQAAALSRQWAQLHASPMAWRVSEGAAKLRDCLFAGNNNQRYACPAKYKKVLTRLSYTMSPSPSGTVPAG